MFSKIITKIFFLSLLYELYLSDSRSESERSKLDNLISDTRVEPEHIFKQWINTFNKIQPSTTKHWKFLRKI